MKISFQRYYSNNKENFLSVSFIILNICLFLFLVGCSYNPFGSPKALLETFCRAYNSSDDFLIKECGRVDYVLNQIVIEKIDPDGNLYFVNVKGIDFEIIKVHKGRIGLEKEFSKSRIIVDVRFFSKIDIKFNKKVTIYMSRKKSSTSSDIKWQINYIPL